MAAAADSPTELGAITARNACVPLISLPTELRKRIYELCIVERDTLIVTPSSRTRHPPLLSVCRTIRSEATRLYYTRNRFVLQVQDYNSTIYVNFLQLRQNYHCKSNIRVALLKASQPSWPNLLEWLRLVYQRRCIEPSGFGGCKSHVERMVLQSMFSIVKEFGQRLDWRGVLVLLEMHHGVLVTLDKRWS